MVNVIKERWEVPWEIVEMVEEIKKHIANQQIIIQHIFREDNQLANYIANEAAKEERITCLFFSSKNCQKWEVAGQSTPPWKKKGKKSKENLKENNLKDFFKIIYIQDIRGNRIEKDTFILTQVKPLLVILGLWQMENWRYSRNIH